jgi:type IX secretion system PorP/SprF family membrane protein
MKKILLYGLFILIGSPLVLFSQDPSNTQFSNTPLYYNPAYTGLYNGLRIRFSTRNENPALRTNQRSFHLSADVADRNLPGSGGFGLILNTDNDGLGFIKNYNLGVSFAVRVPFTTGIIGQAGIKVGWLKKHITWDDFEMSERIKENYGNIYDSGFIRTSKDILNRPDFAIGGLIQFVNSNSCLSGTAGAAVDHLFEPNVSFNSEVSSLLARRWIVHADIVWCVNGCSDLRSAGDKLLKVNPGVVYQYQHGVSSLLTGANVTKFGLYGGLWYKGEFGTVNTNSIAFLGAYRYEFAENMSIKFTYSYDYPVSGPFKNGGGAHEISLVLEFNVFKLFKGSWNPGYGSGKENRIDAQLACSAF